MKKIVIILALFSIGMGVKACDVCSMYMSVGMNDYKNSFGLSFRSQFFKSTIWEEMVLANPYKHFGESELPSLIDKTVEEHYSVYELRGQYYFNPKLSLFGTLPFKHSIQTIEGEKTVDVSGISDPTVLLKYRLHASDSNCDAKYTYRTIVGGGVKFPLGETMKKYNDEYVINDMQLGTGSFDFLISAEHVSMYEDLGVSVNVIYYLKTPNLSRYRFGNGLSTQVFLFYNFKNDKREIRPMMGLYTETDGVDYQDGNEVGSTASTRRFFNWGVEMSQNNFSIYANYQAAVYNKFTGIQLEATQRVVAGIKYYIN